ncbi:MAG: hypothetical protein J6I96_02495 [Oscillospiraceae bacterium]|nr:hypothetical protein [Oscillospiraceae bacterium]
MKKTSIARIAALATVMTIVATGCGQTAGDPIPTVGTTVSTPSEETVFTEETDVITDETEAVTEAVTEAPVTEEEIATETAAVTMPEEEEDILIEGGVVYDPIQAAAKSWSETPMSQVMYVSFDHTDEKSGKDPVYARERAVIGATPIATYHAGDKVTIVAKTDTGYYKVKAGGFIHEEYLSDTKPGTKKVVKTTAKIEEELIDDGDGEDGESIFTEVPVTEEPATTQATAGSSASAPAFTSSGSGAVTLNGTVITAGNYRIDYSKRYAYKQLSQTEQKLYDEIVKAVVNLNTSVFYGNDISDEGAKKIYRIVLQEEPELFWMSGRSLSAWSTSKNLVFSLKCNNKDEIAAMQKEIDAAAAPIIKKANGYKSTVSKLKVCYDTIVAKNDFSLSSEGYNTSIYNGLTGKGQLQCSGYAGTMQYLCDMLGIESTVVCGTTSSGDSHAWNVVYCENGYYNLDTTWADPINDFDSKYIQYEFFLVPDSWIHNITHFDINSYKSNGQKYKLFDPPACTKSACNYFDTYKKLYSSKSDAEAALKKEVDDAIANGTYVCEVRVTDKAIYDSLMSDSYFKTIQKYAQGKSKKVAKLKRQKSYTQGVLVVHYDIMYA